MRAEWDPHERVEHNPLRWVARRWVRLSLLERALTLTPFLLLCAAHTVSWQLEALLVALLAVLSLGLTVLIVARPGLAGHRSERPLGDGTPEIEEIEVDVVFDQNGLMTGEDRGRLALVGRETGTGGQDLLA